MHINCAHYLFLAARDPFHVAINIHQKFKKILRPNKFCKYPQNSSLYSIGTYSDIGRQKLYFSGFFPKMGVPCLTCANAALCFCDWGRWKHWHSAIGPDQRIPPLFLSPPTHFGPNSSECNQAIVHVRLEHLSFVIIASTNTDIPPYVQRLNMWQDQVYRRLPSVLIY